MTYPTAQPSQQRGSKTPIFLLKTKSTPHDGYDEYFSSTGRYEPSFIPVLEHKHNDANLGIVRNLFLSGQICEKYGGLIFTSQRAVEGFMHMITTEVGESITAPASRSLTFYSVGPATHRSLCILRDTHFPHSEVIGQDAGTGEILASLILPHYNEQYARKKDSEKKGKLPLLFLVGETHRDVIPKTLMDESRPAEERIGVEELIVYGTGVMESFAVEFERVLRDVGAWGNADQNTYGDFREHKDGGDADAIWIVVFSPTGCDTMLRTLDLIPSDEASGLRDGNDSRSSAKMLQRKCYIATIGPTTRDHLLKFGIKPHVCAERPSPEGVGKGIEEFMQQRSEKRGTN